MQTENTKNDFQKQSEEVVRKSHNKKVYFTIVIIFTAIAIGLFLGIAIIVNNYKCPQVYKNLLIDKKEKVIEKEDYYDVLEKRCDGDGCCLASLKAMKDNNYKEADKNGKCPEGFNGNMMKCITSYQWCESMEKLNIIGDYRYQSTSMCSQNCDRYYIGFYELVNELKNVKGTNKREAVFATGDMIEVEELPTIAGLDSREQINLNESKVIKFKLDNYQKIDFPKVSILEKELSNYLENKNAEFNLKFGNPLNKELKFKFKIDDFKRYNDFQYVALKPNEIKNIQYIFKKNNNIRNKREEDDTLDLIIINDFVNEENYKKYYWNEANNLDSRGTMIYIEKFVRLEDCIKSDTSD